MTATLTVRGVAAAATRPDRADLTLTLSALDASPDEALAEIALRAIDLKAIFEEIGIAERDRITSGASVKEERDWEKDHYVHRGYLARMSILVRVDDPELIGRLMKRAIEDVDADVAGPRWQVANDNVAHTEARKQAIADARRRADAYAEALGVRIGAVVEVTEPGISQRVSHAVLADAVYESRGAPELEVEAGDVDVHAEIDVVYRIEQ